MTNLRRSTLWAGDATPSNRPEASLSDRLTELLILELGKDGSREYLNLTVRGLYRHVLGAITSCRHSTRDREESEMPTLPLGKAPMNRSSSRQRSVSFETGPQSLPLNQFGSVRQPSEGDEVGPGNAVTYRERLGGYLHPRDMRRLVTPFSASNEPELIVRRHVMLLNFDPLRAIILRDRVLVLVPDGADSLLVNLETRVRGGSTEVEDSIFGKDSRNNSSAEIGGTDHDHSEMSNASDARKKDENIVSKILKKGNSMLHSSAKGNGAGSTNKSTTATPSDAGTIEDEESDDYPNHDDGEWEEMAGRDWVNLPFELQSVDAVLHVVISILSEDTAELKEATLKYIKRLLRDHHGMDDDPLTLIRTIKDAIGEMRSRVKGFLKSMTRILDEDEDMALMNLSRLLTHPERFIQPVPQEVLEEESDEPELILEAHIQIAFTLENALDLIQGQIETASELVDQKLDAVRNRILYVNMVISVLSLCVSSASLVGSLFGMNLSNGLELDPNAFSQITGVTVAGTIVMAISIIALLMYSGTIPRTRFQAEAEQL